MQCLSKALFSEGRSAGRETTNGRSRLLRPLGHYSRWDVARLVLDRRGREPVTEKVRGTRISREDARRISEEYEIPGEKLEALAEELAELLS